MSYNPTTLEKLRQNPHYKMNKQQEAEAKENMILFGKAPTEKGKNQKRFEVLQKEAVYEKEKHI